jgi:hypothetical protein
LNTAQSKSFSIHLQSQFNKKDFTNLSLEEYDSLERELLEEFYSYAEQNREKKWVHWNMRDSNYGFEAIANRYRILGGTPFELSDNRKYDLARIIGQIYTFGYEKNKPNGRLLNLAESNNISTKNALTGEQEATAFEAKEYLKLHLSTLRKTDIIETIINRIENGTLKVKSRIREIYGLSIPGIIEIARNSWWILLIVSILSFIIGAALEPVIQNVFGTSTY